MIHAAVRRDLARLDTALGQVRDGDRERAGDLRRAFDNLRRELTRHHEGEDTYLWPMPAKAGITPDLLSAMESEYAAMSGSLSDTGTAMSTYAGSDSAADTLAVRESVRRTRTVVEEHLAHEEAGLEPRREPHLETPEWKAVEKKLHSVSPTVAGRFFAWLIDDGRTFLRRTVPTPVVVKLSRTFGRSYCRESRRSGGPERRTGLAAVIAPSGAGGSRAGAMRQLSLRGGRLVAAVIAPSGARRVPGRRDEAVQPAGGRLVAAVSAGGRRWT